MTDWLQQNRVAYDQIAVVYSGEAPTEDDPEMRRRVRAAFTDRLLGPRVLEVGCGPGIDSHCFAQQGLQVTATDNCETFLRIARERYPTLNVQRADMTELGFPAASFDGIYGFASLIHLPRGLVDRALRGFHRVLAPGGLLFLSLIQSSIHDEYIIEDWGGRPGNHVLFTCLTEDDMAERLARAGFGEIEHLRISSPVYDELPRLVARGVTGYQVAATARETAPAEPLGQG